jgi:hypothetical protein
MAKAKPYQVANLEASQRAILGSALAARRKVSAARADHDLPDRKAFFTAAEVDAIRAEHRAEIEAISRAVGRYQQSKRIRTGPIVIGNRTLEQQQAIDWANTVAAAERIVAERSKDTATRALDRAHKRKE